MNRCGSVLFGTLLAASALSQTKPQSKFTVDAWIDGKGRTESVPSARWTTTGDLLLFSRSRGPERVNPLTLERTQAYDEAAIARVIANAGGPTLKTLGVPLEIEPSGKRALFQFANAVWAVDLGFLGAVKVVEGDVKAVTFSPDGDKVAYVKDNNLCVFFVRPARTVALTTTGSKTLLNGTLNWVYWEEIFGRHDVGYWWSPDSRAIAFLETDESMIEPSIFVDPRTKIETVIEQRYPKAGTPNPRVRVGITELRDPQTQWVGPQQDTYEYVLRVKWLPDSSRVAIITMNRPQTDATLTFAPRTGGEGRTVLIEHDDAYVNVTDDLTFLKGGAEFIWASERTGYYHLYRYDAEGKLLNAVTKGNWTLVSNPGPAFWVRQSVSAVDETNGWVYFTTNRGASIDRHLYRAKLDGSRLQRITKEPGRHGVSFNADATQFIDTYSNLKTPSRLTLNSPEGGSKVLFRARPPAVHVDVAKTFTIPARDGFPMPAMIRKPRDFSPKKRYPVIVYCYGGPSAPSVVNAWEGADFSQVLVDAGFIVLVFDNRTAAAISKKLEALSLREYMGRVELNDLVDAARWIKKQPYVDPQRIGLWGWSNGGTYTLLGMTRSKEFKAGIAVAAVVDQSLYDSKWAESLMKTPDSNPKGYEAVRLDRYAKDLSGRLLLVHGTYDDNVHPQQAWTFIEALIQANRQFDMLWYPMRKHGINDEPARRHLYTAMLAFWKRWL